MRRICLGLIFILIFVWGCSQFADTIPATTGKTYSQSEVSAFFPNQYVIFGDQNYAEVNPDFAGKWHSYTDAVLSMLGMAPNWSEQFDCNRFANVKLAVIHVRFLVDTWSSRNPAAGPAAGEFWYAPNAVPGGIMANSSKQKHAILVTIEKGQRSYRDIYSSKRLILTPAEEASAFLIKF